MTLREILTHLKPHRTVPVVPWTAQSRWDLSFKRVFILFFGLAIFGLGDGLIIQSGLGNAPWSVLGGCPGFCVNGLSFKPATADLRIQ